MSGTPEIAEVAIVAGVTGTREVQALQAELGKLNLSTIELNRQQQRFVQTTIRQAESFGKTKAELAGLRAEQLGLGSTLGPVISKWREAEIAAVSGGSAIKHAMKDAEGGIKGFLQHGGVMRELIVLFHESVIMGNYSRFGGSLMVLAERADVAHLMFTALFGAIAGGVATVAAMTAGFVEGELETVRFGHALQMSGGYAGITAGQFNTMAEVIGREVPGSIGEARAAMIALIRTGAVSGEALFAVTRAAVLFGQVTGEKSAKVIADFAKMSDGVAKWAANANRSYHFLSLAQYDYIAQLEQQGHKEKAEEVTANALYRSLGENAPKNLGYLMEAWYGVRDAIVATWDALKNVGRAQTLSDKIAQIDLQLKGGGMANRLNPFRQQGLLAERAKLEAEMQQHRKAAADTAHKAQVQEQGIAAEQSLTRFRQSMLKGPALARQHVAALQLQVKQALAANPQDPTALYIQSHWSEAVTQIDRRYAGAHSAGVLRGHRSAASAVHEHARALNAHASAALHAAQADARFNTQLRLEGAEVQNEIASIRANTSHVKSAALARKLLADQLSLEAWARKEIAKYPSQAAQITAFAHQQAGQFTSLPVADATGAAAAPQTAQAGTAAAFSGFVTSSQQTASQVKAIWSQTWTGLTGQLTKALTGQRTTLRSFAHGIFTDLTSMVVKDAIMAPLASGMGRMFGFNTPQASALSFFQGLAGFTSGATPGGGGGGVLPSRMGGMGTPGLPMPTAGGSIAGDLFGGLKSGLSIFNTFKGLAGIGSSIGSAWSGSLLQKGILGIASMFADGGIMTPMGPMPLNAYAGGGVASSPQVALFGEGRMPEAYVPLPDGRSIPVQMRGGGGAGSVFHMHTTINHNGAPGFDPAEAAREMHRQFQQMIDRRMIQLQRDGGLLATNGTSYR
jgi:lambda family phage tail tape measure protein